MNDYWHTRLELFRQAPVIDLFGAMIKGISGFTGYAEPDICIFSFCFGAWRVDEGDVQIGWLRVTLLIPHSEVKKLVFSDRWLLDNDVVHIKARIIENEVGYIEALYEEWIEPASQEDELQEIHQKLNKRITLDLPPLPPSINDEYGRGPNSSITLLSWANFCPASEPHYKRPNGLFTLEIESDEEPTVRFGYIAALPTPAQFAAYSYLVENDEAVRDAVLQAILEQYPQWQADYGGDPEYMPDVTHPIQFESLLSLRYVTISSTAKQGFAYVYLSLNPEWDIEHGMAAVIHKDRVIAVGDHDSMYKVAEMDASGEPNT